MGLAVGQTNSGSWSDGHIPWNKGMTGYMFGHKWRKGECTGEKNPFFGKKHTEETKIKMRKKKLGKYAEKSSAWQGGKTHIRTTLMSREKYKEWRGKIFKRDNYICQICNKRGGELEAHHKKPYYKFPELILDINNGQTLCLKCHRNLHINMRRKENGSSL